MNSVERQKRSKEWIEAECLRVLRSGPVQTASKVEIELYDDGHSHNWRIASVVENGEKITWNSHPRTR